MQVLVARKAGFCSGVSRAVNTLLEEVEIYGAGATLGPVAHNEDVVAYLRERKVIAINEPEEARGSFLAVRTHGVAPDILGRISRLEGVRVVDLTCPRVKKVQEIASQAAQKGYSVIIYGNRDHPEVKGLIGWAGEGAIPVSAPEELQEIEFKKPSILISQTTGNPGVYEQLKALYKNMDPEGQIYDTLCPETDYRHKETAELAKRVEALVVVGSKTSANTKALYDSCRQLKPSCRVTNAEELDFNFLRQYRVIGVTAGASTPPWTIKEVVERMENENMETTNDAVEKEEQENEETKNGEKELDEQQPGEVSGEEKQPDDPAEPEDLPEEASAGEAPQETPEASAEEESADEDRSGEAPAAEEAAREESEAETAGEAAQAEEQFDYSVEIKQPQEGEQVSGKVARVTDEEVYVDIGAKTEAILPVNEVHLGEGQALSDIFKPEDDLEVTVLNIDDQEGKVIVSHKRLARDKRLKELEEAFENQVTLEGKVKQVVSAGIVVDLGEGIEGFMPGSLVDTRFIPDFNEFRDKEVSFKIQEFDREKGKLILNRRKLMEEESAKHKESTLNALEVGSTITGTVKRLTDFGAFIDVGGIDGLAHISELSWERVKHPKEILKVGDEVEVKILEVIPEKERISLSIRKTQPDPWTRAISDLETGQLVTGRVTRLVNFGAFIEIKPGVEGLAHISQLADYHVKHPSEIISEGDEVEVKVIELKPKAKRISLSLKEAGGVAVAQGSSQTDEGDDGSVTLGDVFGDLFEDQDYKEEENAGEENEAEPGPAEEEENPEPEGDRE